MRLVLATLIAAAFAATGLAYAADEIAVTIKDHRIEPAEINLEAGQKAILRVTNQDPTPEEFESHDLDIEKVIPGGQSAIVRIGPLEAGRYEFYGEYHEDTAKGAVVVK